MEVINMSIENKNYIMKLKHYQKNFTNQVINFIEYLKISYIDTEAPDSITIKSKKRFKREVTKRTR